MDCFAGRLSLKLAITQHIHQVAIRQLLAQPSGWDRRTGMSPAANELSLMTK